MVENRGVKVSEDLLEIVWWKIMAAMLAERYGSEAPLAFQPAIQRKAYASPHSFWMIVQWFEKPC